MTTHKNLATAALLLISTSVFSQGEGTSLQSDWLELVKGHKGESMGVELMSIEPGDTEGTQKITLSIPKESMSHPDTIEEVVVMGRKPEKPESLDIRYEWLQDYDNDNYGLVIHIGSDSNWPIRLFMNSEAGFIR